jgi:hypothetical protein
VVVAQGRAQGADDVGQADLVGGDDVGVALDDGDPAGLAGRGPGQVLCVERPALLEQGRLGGVQVLGGAAARLGQLPLEVRQEPAAEADRPAPHVADREDQTPPEPVAGRAGRLGAAGDQPGPLQQRGGEARAPALPEQPVAGVGGEPQAEPRDALGREAPPRDVGPRLGRPRQGPGIDALGPGVDGQQVGLRCPGRRRRRGGIVQGHTGPLGQHAERLGKLDSFVRLHKIEDVAARPAAPTLERLALGVQFQRGVVIVVERTQGLELRARAVQGEVVAD